MKKIVITIVTFFYCLSGFCQAIYLKSKDVISFQIWDTIYASVRNDSIILTDKKGKNYKLTLGVGKNGWDAVIKLFEDKYHYHGISQNARCRNGSVLMDENMKLFLYKESWHFSSDFSSPFTNHGSHYSHRSHYSSM